MMGACMTHLSQDELESVRRMAKRIRRLRLQSGVPGRKVVEHLNVSKSVYYRWENGETSPPAHIVRRICQLWECSSDWLLGIDAADEVAA